MRLGASLLLCLRTKFRGNPKALGFAAPHHRMKWWCEGITKDKTETSYLASLIIEGIVTLLEITAVVMGDRGSKSDLILKSAKEQRVDGSSIIQS